MSRNHEALTRAKVGLLVDDIRISAAEIAACGVRISTLVARIDDASAQLYRGLLDEIPPDIEIQPRVVRSA